MNELNCIQLEWMNEGLNERQWIVSLFIFNQIMLHEMFSFNFTMGVILMRIHTYLCIGLGFLLTEIIFTSVFVIVLLKVAFRDLYCCKFHCGKIWSFKLNFVTGYRGENFIISGIIFNVFDIFLWINHRWNWIKLIQQFGIIRC